MAFLTIHLAQGLDERRYRAALQAGPRAVGARRRGYTELLNSSGFASVRAVNLTAEFRETAQALFDLRQARADDLSRVLGEQTFTERQSQFEQMLSALDDGLLERSLFVAV